MATPIITRLCVAAVPLAIIVANEAVPMNLSPSTVSTLWTLLVVGVLWVVFGLSPEDPAERPGPQAAMRQWRMVNDEDTRAEAPSDDRLSALRLAGQAVAMVAQGRTVESVSRTRGSVVSSGYEDEIQALLVGHATGALVQSRSLPIKSALNENHDRLLSMSVSVAIIEGSSPSEALDDALDQARDIVEANADAIVALTSKLVGPDASVDGPAVHALVEG